MRTFLLEIEQRSSPVQTKVKKVHFWFDSVENRMHQYEGGRFNFEWNAKEKRLKPKLRFEWNEKTRRYDALIDDDYRTTWQRTDNREQIEKWIREIGSRLGVEVNRDESSNKGVAIDVDEDAISVVEYALDRQGIRYSEITERGKRKRNG